jgi:hypothetical protein
MTQQDLVHELINTYRDLNLAIRGTPGDPKTRIQNDPKVRNLLRAARDYELRHAEQLKEQVTGVPVDEVVEDEDPTLGTEQISDQAQVLLSQFGTAREATLSLLRGLDEQTWNEVGASGMSVRAIVERLIDHDRQLVTQLSEILNEPIGTEINLTPSGA